jgi:hypothetical protein
MPQSMSRLLAPLLVVGLAAGACSDGPLVPDEAEEEDWEPGSGSFVLSGSAEGEKEALAWFTTRAPLDGGTPIWEIVLSEQPPYHPMPALFRLVLRGPADPTASAALVGTHQVQPERLHPTGWTARFEDMETHFPWSVSWGVTSASSGGTLTITEANEKVLRGAFRFRLDPLTGTNKDRLVEFTEGEFVAHRLP